jgi:selenocysteine lyase/cysteine desulfurase
MNFGKTIDWSALREDFPVHGQPLIYFDNPATSRQPIVFSHQQNAVGAAALPG